MEAEKREIPIVIAYGIPDSQVGKDVKELTGKDGKIIFLSVGSKDKDVREFQQRYDLIKAGAVLTDEFGNPLKADLKTSEEIADAYYELDELMAERFKSWRQAIKQGKLLLEKKRYSEAAAVLKVFAFTSGTDLAKEGKKLFDQVAQQASNEYEKLTVITNKKEVKDLDEKTRDMLFATLSTFIEKWPKTPAAFVAESLKQEIASLKDV